ncbi:MAG: hypothetical protein ACR65R_05000 [Methylomicrobium sp.]
MKKFLKYLSCLVGLSLLGILALYAYINFVVLDDPFDNRDFDGEVWLKYQRNMNPDNPRGEMYEDLMENYLHKGMSKSKVIGLLGQPDFQDTGMLMSYNLGMWSGMRIDYDSLDLHFSKSGELTKYYRVQH